MGSSMSASIGNVKSQMVEFQAQQREIQMAVMMAQTRDLVQYIAGVWTGLIGVGVLAKVKSGAFPVPLLVPLSVLPLIATYQADMAYNTKMRRVTLEAEHILEHERYRFIPPKQAPFAYLYEKELEARQLAGLDSSQRVGLYWPAFIRDIFEKK
mmetsp:Transcript_16275/g.29775  ORF Transcript_16275/g.29775 Transcript_16275/m.29775 type:complete len:154 (+) Transcript_16275:180-641(+)